MDPETLELLRRAHAVFGTPSAQPTVNGADNPPPLDQRLAGNAGLHTGGGQPQYRAELTRFRNALAASAGNDTELRKILAQLAADHAEGHQRTRTVLDAAGADPAPAANTPPASASSSPAKRPTPDKATTPSAKRTPAHAAPPRHCAPCGTGATARTNTASAPNCSADSPTPGAPRLSSTHSPSSASTTSGEEPPPAKGWTAADSSNTPGEKPASTCPAPAKPK
ncbi:hypothetical protein [Mycobacterium kubicae]|uniref:hypothetical protein n=1 Tax=Mycobacterium kubicae TaxID=120959 RepID=UPI001FD17CDE|nr:hypothetical protein [Mycobacterium kubicae]